MSDIETTAEDHHVELPIELTLIHDRRVNYALQQNDVPVVKQLQLKNTSDEDLSDLTVALWIEGNLSERAEYRIQRIPADGACSLDEVDLPLDAVRLKYQGERESTRLVVTVCDDSGATQERSFPMEVLAHNEWGGVGTCPEITAAFVMPNHVAVEGVLSAASQFLKSASGSSSLDGYQSKNPLRVRQIVESCWSAICNLEIAYVNPPASFEAAPGVRVVVA